MMPSAALVSMAICIFVIIQCANACPPKKVHPVEFDSSMPEYMNQAVKRFIKGHLEHRRQFILDSLREMMDSYYPDENVAVLLFDPIAGFQNHAHMGCGSNAANLFYFRAEQRLSVVIYKGQARHLSDFNQTRSHLIDSYQSPRDRNAKNFLSSFVNQLSDAGFMCQAIRGVSVIFEGDLLLSATHGRMSRIHDGHGYVVFAG